jgi:hypothetical protein
MSPLGKFLIERAGDMCNITGRDLQEATDRFCLKEVSYSLRYMQVGNYAQHIGLRIHNTSM